MIKVTVISNKDGFMDIKVEGHAQKDVCNVVSTILQSKVRFLQELALQYPNDLKINVKEE